jgi:hypothetical protein
LQYTFTPRQNERISVAVRDMQQTAINADLHPSDSELSSVEAFRNMAEATGLSPFAPVNDWFITESLAVACEGVTMATGDKILGAMKAEAYRQMIDWFKARRAPVTPCARRRYAMRRALSGLCVASAGLQVAIEKDARVDPAWAEDLQLRIKALTDEIYTRV